MKGLPEADTVYWRIDYPSYTEHRFFTKEAAELYCRSHGIKLVDHLNPHGYEAVRDLWGDGEYNLLAAARRDLKLRHVSSQEIHEALSGQNNFKRQVALAALKQKEAELKRKERNERRKRNHTTSATATAAAVSGDADSPSH